MMRFVELKTERQLDMQTLHRVRDRLIGERTSLMDQIRSLLLERGHVMPQGRARLAARLDEMFVDLDLAFSRRILELIRAMRERWRAFDERIQAFDDEFVQQAINDEHVRRLVTIPGIGALNARESVAGPRCPRLVKGRSPDSRPVSWNPLAKNGALTPTPL